MPSTFEQRNEQTRKIVDDDLVTFKETIVYIYNWMMYEYALNAEARVQRRINRHSLRLQNAIHVFNARHEMEDL
jgi:hypothetical protein